MRAGLAHFALYELRHVRRAAERMGVVDQFVTLMLRERRFAAVQDRPGVAGAPGLEPGTLCLEGRCSIQLSYAPAALSS